MTIRKETITLEGRAYEITVPLTLGQLMDIGVVASSDPPADQKEAVRASYERSIGIIACAIAADHPDVVLTIEAARAMRITRAELTAAVDKVLTLSGLRGSAETGEAAAEASTGNT